VSIALTYTADWSEEQLMKHSKEIESYLGNFYLRVTSLHMAHLISIAKPRTLQEVYTTCLFGGSEDPLSAIVTKQGSLAQEVEDCLERLEVGRALQLIMDLLIDVRPHSFLSILSH
jgi:methionyl-tRNA synthetase